MSEHLTPSRTAPFQYDESPCGLLLHHGWSPVGSLRAVCCTIGAADPEGFGFAAKGAALVRAAAAGTVATVGRAEGGLGGGGGTPAVGRAASGAVATCGIRDKRGFRAGRRRGIGGIKAEIWLARLGLADGCVGAVTAVVMNVSGSGKRSIRAEKGGATAAVSGWGPKSHCPSC
jgi:hypothetical protein